MKKKILATILVVGLLAAQTLTAFAAGSKITGAVSASEGYTVSDLPSYDGKEQNLEALVAGSGSTVENLAKDYKALSKVFDVKAQANATAPYTITFTKDTIKAGVSDVRVLHYTGSVWEDVTVDGSADLNAHTVTGRFTSLSPVIIIAKVAATTTDATGVATSPKTGVESTWGIWAVAGLVLAGAAVVTAKKGKRA